MTDKRTARADERMLRRFAASRYKGGVAWDEDDVDDFGTPSPAGFRMLDFCASCSRDLCPSCMEKGCCGNIPA